jgi:transposase
VEPPQGSISVRAKCGGEHTGPNPTDRGKRGSKYHVLVDQPGIPLAVQLTAANVYDSKLLESLVDAVLRSVAQSARPDAPASARSSCMPTRDTTSRRPGRHCGGVASRPGSHGGPWSQAHAWVVTAEVMERTQGCVVRFRKLTVRYDQHAASVLAFLHLACAVICLRFLAHAEADAH